MVNLCMEFNINSELYYLQETLHNHPINLILSDEKNIDGQSNDVENDKVIESLDGPMRATAKTKRSLWRNREMIAAVFVYCLWALHSMAYSEVKTQKSVVQLYFSYEVRIMV